MSRDLSSVEAVVILNSLSPKMSKLQRDALNVVMKDVEMLSTLREKIVDLQFSPVQCEGNVLCNLAYCNVLDILDKYYQDGEI